jgi:flavodoxin
MKNKQVFSVVTAGFLLALMVIFLTRTVRAEAQTQQGARKILIAYFTRPESDGVDTVSGASRVVVDGKVSGNVELAANSIQKAAGGDLFVIRTVRTYPAGHRPLLETAQSEQKANAHPPLAAHIPNLQNYDTIFIGYPIWWYDLPMPLYRFFDEYNFAGKTIITFTVHGGSRFSGTVEKIITLEPQAAVSREGLALSRNDVARSERDIIAWLRRLGMAK